MSEILKRLKLVQDIEVELKTSKKKFIQNLKNNVDDEEINFRTSLLDVFSSALSKYKGKVGFKGFTLKRRSRLFDLGKGIAVVNGDYIEKGSTLLVMAKVNGFQGGMKLYYILMALFYLFFITSIMNSISALRADELSFTILMTILQMIFFFGMPYLIMRRSIRYLSNEIEKDFKNL